MNEPEARKQVTSGASDIATLGILFILLGAVPLLFGFVSRRLGLGAQVLLAVDAFVLIGPAAWYLVAAKQIRRLNRQSVTTSIRVAALQIAATVAAMLIGLFGSYAIGMREEVFIVPAFLTMFFIPALLALTRVLRKARDAMNFIEPDAQGFEAISLATPLPVQSIDNFREK
jgi:hypothetical protein